MRNLSSVLKKLRQEGYNSFRERWVFGICKCWINEGNLITVDVVAYKPQEWQSDYAQKIVQTCLGSFLVFLQSDNYCVKSIFTFKTELRSYYFPSFISLMWISQGSLWCITLFVQASVSNLSTSLYDCLCVILETLRGWVSGLYLTVCPGWCLLQKKLLSAYVNKNLPRVSKVSIRVKIPLLVIGWSFPL